MDVNKIKLLINDQSYDWNNVMKAFFVKLLQIPFVYFGKDRKEKKKEEAVTTVYLFPPETQEEASRKLV